MSDLRIFDGVSLLGLVASGAAVCDMLLVWNMVWLQSAFVIYALAVFLTVAVVLVVKKANAYFSEACRQGPRLLALRLALALALFLLGWYVNAAMGAIHGKTSPEVAYNGARMLAVTATLVGYVFYFGFARRAKKG